MDCAISKLCYEGKILHRQYRKMTISYKSIVKFHGQKIWVPEHDHITVKPVLSCHSKIDKRKMLMTNGSLMKVESIAECYTFDLH